MTWFQKIIAWFKSWSSPNQLPPPPGQPVGVPPPTPIKPLPAPRNPHSNNIRVPITEGQQITRGIDVYHGDTILDWANVKTVSDYVYFKASEGSSVQDPAFRKNIKAARAAGLLVGAYHFFRPDQDPIVQARNFLSAIAGNFQAGIDLPPMFDWEAPCSSGAVYNIARAKVFLSTIEGALKVKPLLYFSPGYYNELGNPVDFYEYAIWLANYGHPAPAVPPPWSQWQFWQWSETGRVSGTSGNVDTDIFNGTLDQLKAFCLSSKM